MGAASKQAHDESESSLEADSDPEMETELSSVQSEQDEGGSGREPESEYNDESNMDEGNGGDKMQRDAEMKELQREYQTLCSEEQDLLKKLKHHKDEDAIKGQAVKNQKALWDKALEFRFLIQKTFSLSNKLPQENVKSYFCNSDKAVDQAYSELISSSKHALSCILELQEALLENNPSITQGSGKGSCKDEELLSDLKREDDEEWSNICKLHHRISPFRNNSVDRWHRKTQVSTGAAVFRGKLNAFNQNISDQVDGYMRDPNRMIRRMQLRRSHVGVFGKVLEEHRSIKEENQEGDFDGDPELVDDSEFYQQLLKEFFESCDPTSSEAALYALKKLQPKKRKIVDRRVSKSRKIRYNIHEKIVNFMAPLPMTLPPMAPKLFENLLGMGNKKSSVP